jgi:hypothetical protein
MTKKHFWMSRGTTCAPSKICESLPHAFECCTTAWILYIYSQITNCPWDDMVITKKNHYEKIKKPFEINFNFLTSKGILVVSQCFWFFFKFFIFVQIWNFLSSYMIIIKKIIWKAPNCPLMLVLKILFLRVF